MSRLQTNQVVSQQWRSFPRLETYVNLYDSWNSYHGVGIPDNLLLSTPAAARPAEGQQAARCDFTEEYA